MADINHSALTDPFLHEPKGASTASANQVYLADGTGSGTWTTLASETQYTISGVIEDISTAKTIYIPTVQAGTVKEVTTVLGGAITVADATLDIKNSAGTSMGTITVEYSGSAAGDIDTLTPASNNTFTASSFVTIETDGGSTDTAPLYYSILVERT